MPRYFAAIPETGVTRFPSYSYRTFPEGGIGRMVWYDLGQADENAGPERLAGAGPRDRAIFIASYCLEDCLSQGHVARLAGDAPDEPFDAGHWRAEPAARRSMARDLLRGAYPRLRRVVDLTRLLGEPDGRGVLLEVPWELRVECSWGTWNEDRVIYWPGRNYDPGLARTHRIGDWLYVCDDF